MAGKRGRAPGQRFVRCLPSAVSSWGLGGGRRWVRTAGSWASSPCTLSRSMLGADGANWTPCPQPYYHSERRHSVAMVLWREAVAGREISVESSLGFSSYVQALVESDRMVRDEGFPAL